VGASTSGPWDADVLRAAHRESIRHRPVLMRSERCGCFHCLEEFAPGEILDWVDEGDVTALCPRCGIDSVVGSASGYPVTREFLAAMQAFWF
jgi:hypothetical protein